jgi:AmmeMemoRadiSam system protein A
MEYSSDEEKFLIRTACWTIRRRLEGQPGPVAVQPSSNNILRPAGCFVSLHRRTDHALRGCIGRVDSASPLLETLLNVAWGAAQDPRFASQPVTLSELPQLAIEITVLGPLKPTANPLDFSPENDGLYLSISGRTGVFLPQVARDTKWSKEQLLDRLAQEKMGLPPGAWRHPMAKLFIYPAKIIGPVDFLVDVQMQPYNQAMPNVI